jgi:hypothetical protein
MTATGRKMEKSRQTILSLARKGGLLSIQISTAGSGNRLATSRAVRSAIEFRSTKAETGKDDHEHRSESSGTARGAALRSAPVIIIGGSFRGTHCAWIYPEPERPWDILLRRDDASRRSDRGINFYHALRNHTCGKHAGSLSWTSVARHGFPGGSKKRYRRTTRFLPILALGRVHLAIRTRFGRKCRRSGFRPGGALNLSFQ